MADSTNDNGTGHVGAPLPFTPVTPPKRLEPHPQSLHDTPWIVRVTDQPEFTSGNHEKKRSLIPKALQNMVPETDPEWIIDHLLPPLPDGLDLDAVMRTLEIPGSGATVDGRWRAFALDPIRTNNEDKTFAHLEPVFDSIVRAAQQQRSCPKPKFKLLLRPRLTPMSAHDNRNRPDLFWLEVEEASELETAEMHDEIPNLSWYQLAATGEVKRANETSIKNMNDNVTKTVANMQQVMALDPSRRFNFAITIANRDFRLWYGNRAVVMTSKPFDFLTDHRRLVHIFLSFAFASREALGWDPSFKLVGVDEHYIPTYEIKVNNKAYTTIGVLAESTADNPVGCATRVWEVKSETDDKSYVLKDSWLDIGRPSDKEVRTSILKAVSSDEERDRLKTHLLTIHEEEKLQVDGAADSTEVMMCHHSPSIAPDHLFRLCIDKPLNILARSYGPSTATDPDTQTPTIRSEKQPRICIRHKYHIRTIFTQCATTMYKEKSLSNVLTALTDAVRALQIIHNAGWVHRDISGGNVYCYTDPATLEPRGLLGDFEFARLKGGPSKHEVRTGTPDFMAGEVIGQRFEFLPLPPRAELANYKRPKFYHNDLHDLESVWWILVYLLYFNDDRDNVIEDPSHVAGRREKTIDLFSRDIHTTHRRPFLQDYHRLNVADMFLSPSLEPAVNILADMAEVLLRAYQRAQLDCNGIDPEAFKIHDTLAAILRGEFRSEADKISLVDVKHKPFDGYATLQAAQSRSLVKRKGGGLDDVPKSKRSKRSTPAT